MSHKVRVTFTIQKTITVEDDFVEDAIEKAEEKLEKLGYAVNLEDEEEIIE